MPSLWNDVRHDAAATERLVRELVGTAVAVEEVIGVLAADGPLIADDWGGPHRATFDDECGQLLLVAEAVRELLLGAARAATAALAAAEGEQRLRVRLRAELADHACVAGRAC